MDKNNWRSGAGIFLGAIFTLSALQNASASPPTHIEKVRVYQTDPRYSYHIELLELILSKTEPQFGPVQLEKLSPNITNKRGTAMLKAGQLDIAVYASTREREATLHSVKIPLLQGLLGYRVFLINKEDQQRFFDMSTIEQLRELQAGSGAHWADNNIFNSNQLPLFTTPKYSSLFQQLSKRRFDYFPRGIGEAKKEMKSYGKQYPSMALESTKALFYPFPVYFYVSKQNTRLAQRLEAGLQHVIADGSMRQLFVEHHADSIDELKQHTRQVFCLNNTSLEINPDFQIDWWIKPSQATQLCQQAH